MNQLAKTESQPTTLKQYLKSDALRQQIADALPKHMSADRMCRVTLTALTRTPGLATCDQASFFKCLLDLSAWGLEPDGRRAHLIPYNNRKRGITECQLIIDYKGIVELAYRSGQVKHIHADVVHAGDVFRYSLGRVTEHVPHAFRWDDDKPQDRGEPIAAYAMVEMTGGATKYEVMTLGEIEAIRNRSQSGQRGPWVSDWAEMAKKTVFRRASKWIPLSSEVHEAFASGDDYTQPPQPTAPPATGVAGLAAKLEALDVPGDAVRAAPIEADYVPPDAEIADDVQHSDACRDYLDRISRKRSLEQLEVLRSAAMGDQVLSDDERTLVRMACAEHAEALVAVQATQGEA